MPAKFDYCFRHRCEYLLFSFFISCQLFLIFPILFSLFQKERALAKQKQHKQKKEQRNRVEKRKKTTKGTTKLERNITL